MITTKPAEPAMMAISEELPLSVYSAEPSVGTASFGSETSAAGSSPVVLKTFRSSGKPPEKSIIDTLNSVLLRFAQIRSFCSPTGSRLGFVGRLSFVWGTTVWAVNGHRYTVNGR
jgi:hypothetical protein